tara:strand:- start:1670 stop:2194 length:525 start_codon:yes stop_codon:yes gene_type:complete
MKKNFDVDRLNRNLRAATSVLLNDLAKPIKEDWDNRIKTSVPPRLKESTKSLHGSHIPLNLTGKLAKSNKISPASTKRLKAVVKNVAKSSKNYKIKTPSGKTRKGTRNSAPVFYGYWLNKGFTTSLDSLVPNKKVPARDFSSINMEVFKTSAAYINAHNKFIKNLKKAMKMVMR